MAQERRKVLVLVDGSLADWTEFNGSLDARGGMSAYFVRLARSDYENAEPERLQAFELWRRLRHTGSEEVS